MTHEHKILNREPWNKFAGSSSGKVGSPPVPVQVLCAPGNNTLHTLKISYDGCKTLIQSNSNNDNNQQDKELWHKLYPEVSSAFVTAQEFIMTSTSCSRCFSWVRKDQSSYSYQRLKHRVDQRNDSRWCYQGTNSLQAVLVVLAKSTGRTRWGASLNYQW